MISRLDVSAKTTGLLSTAGIGVMIAAALFMTGCGDKKEKDKPASQTAAKVNKEEITVHQINYVLQQQRGLAPEQAASASKQVLERLVDQELAVQKAQEQKLDRDPRVVQQIEASRREIVARAYVDKIAAGAPKPSPAEIKAYYDAHPALFKERKVYNLQELAIQAKPEQRRRVSQLGGHHRRGGVRGRRLRGRCNRYFMPIRIGRVHLEGDRADRIAAPAQRHRDDAVVGIFAGGNMVAGSEGKLLPVDGFGGGGEQAFAGGAGARP